MSTLKNAVIEQLGYDDIEDQELLDTLNDIYNYGIAGGFSGFIYYTDTVQFFKDNKKAIVELAKEQAQEFGESLIEFIKGFNCLDATDDEIGETLYSDEINNFVANALSWFAAEHIAREIVED